MNKDTLWLQVPAAKRQTLTSISLAACDANITDKFENLTHKSKPLQNHPALLNEITTIENTTIILFIADHGIILDNDIKSLHLGSRKSLIACSERKPISRILKEAMNAKIEIINLGTKRKLGSTNEIINSIIDSGTNNFCHTPAMNKEQLAKAINIGRQSAQRIKLSDAQLFVASDINNENLLSALAMTCVLLDINLNELTDIDVKQKGLIHQALIKHKINLTSPLEILRCLGSFEIAALTGSYLCCAHMGMPVLIDGFASAVAALVTTRLCPGAEQWFLYSTTPSNNTHKRIFEILKAQPLLKTNQSNDSESGIAAIVMALSQVQVACNRHNERPVFTEEKLFQRYS